MDEITDWQRKRRTDSAGYDRSLFQEHNYAVDRGLYAEMIENRSFEFVEAFGDAKDYYTMSSGHTHRNMQ